MASREQWGNITWYLFHGIAEKIKEEKFSENKDLIINIIKSICGNLPCPDCADHATKTLNSINFNTINSKNELKEFLFKFHNIVNQRIKKQQFKFEELDKKYSCIIMPIIFNYFFKVYSINNRNEKMMMHTAFKNKFLSQLRKNLNKLIIHLNN
uniref:Sulfhydryl oxidase n=1 Tax=Nucleocytoviricota sp. TaxID=2809609 RepID=A0A9E8G4X1_9VIRU|nr:hypothetical protein [Nucleocytoviricota sp.]UZT29107.1 hypothetical protein [Nucleocytoviricota sp.]